LLGSLEHQATSALDDHLHRVALASEAKTDVLVQKGLVAATFDSQPIGVGYS
jgi:hypothetical protein